LNTELFIARRVFSAKKENKGISSKIVSIAVASISISLAVMIISVAILIGFKQQVREKVIGFGSHFQIVNFDSNYSFETQAIEIDSTLIKKYLSIPHIKHIQQYATKPGIIKTDSEIHGMVLKGVSKNFDWSFFKKNLVAGNVPSLTQTENSNEVIISEKVSLLLKLRTGDPLYCYFYNEGESAPRSRKFTISGIYNTSLEEFDEMYVLGDLKNVQILNNWNDNQISGYELMIDDFNLLDQVFDVLRDVTLNSATDNSMLKVYSIVTRY